MTAAPRRAVPAEPEPTFTESDGPVKAVLADGVLRLVLAEPQRRNSLSEALMEALGDALDRAAQEPSVRVVVIAAEGHVYSAGHDLKELTRHRTEKDRGRSYFASVMGRCSALMLSIVEHPKPVIAEVGGIATAAGCQLVASCDLAIAAETARFQTPGVHIGLFCSTPMVALSRAVSRKHALEMLLTGDMVDAARAAEIGLVNRVVPAAALTDATMALAARIASKSSLTLKIGKRLFQDQLDRPLEEAYRVAAETMVENMLAADAEEGIGAFLDKRPPQWKGR
jgi:enoyl-CoA hydratase/carnithine racemase